MAEILRLPVKRRWTKVQRESWDRRKKESDDRWEQDRKAWAKNYGGRLVDVHRREFAERMILVLVENRRRDAKSIRQIKARLKELYGDRANSGQEQRSEG